MKFHASIVQARHRTRLGSIVLAATDQGLAGIWFEGQRHEPDRAGWPVQPDHPVLREAAAQLDDFFAGKRRGFDLPLDLRGGTPFQQSVWTALLTIPRGATATYAEVAQRVAKSGSARAVGAAVGRNPVSIVVPCHRVVGSDGSLTGYAGGLPRKLALLQLEQAP